MKYVQACVRTDETFQVAVPFGCFYPSVADRARGKPFCAIRRYLRRVPAVRCTERCSVCVLLVYQSTEVRRVPSYLCSTKLVLDQVPLKRGCDAIPSLLRPASKCEYSPAFVLEERYRYLLALRSAGDRHMEALFPRRFRRKQALEIRNCIVSVKQRLTFVATSNPILCIQLLLALLCNEFLRDVTGRRRKSTYPQVYNGCEGFRPCHTISLSQRCINRPEC